MTNKIPTLLEITILNIEAVPCKKNYKNIQVINCIYDYIKINLPKNLFLKMQSNVYFLSNFQNKKRTILKILKYAKQNDYSLSTRTQNINKPILQLKRRIEYFKNVRRTDFI